MKRLAATQLFVLAAAASLAQATPPERDRYGQLVDGERLGPAHDVLAAARLQHDGPDRLYDCELAIPISDRGN
jgi:hypothetical protein